MVFVGSYYSWPSVYPWGVYIEELSASYKKILSFMCKYILCFLYKIVIYSHIILIVTGRVTEDSRLMD